MPRSQSFIDSRFPNLLIVQDDSFRPESEHRDRLRDLLYGELQGAVGRGSHDFWITYRIPDSSGTPNHSREDMGVRPRPMRGMILMEVPGDASYETVQGHTGTLLQEAGHHWLVPSDLRFRRPEGEIAMLGARELVDRVNRDVGWEQPPLLGRGGTHWSTYFDADASPMDGMHWRDRGWEHGERRWDQEDLAATTYNDLDLALMGALDPAAAYPHSGNEVRWLEPFLCSNLSYHAGLTVAFSQFDHICFGFYRDHRVLVIERTDRGGDRRGAELGDGHDLWAPLALRVRREGEWLHFEAAWSAASLLDGGTDATPFGGGVLSLATDRFKTVASLHVPQPPVGVGAMLKTWAPLLVELDIDRMELADGAGRRTFEVHRQPPEFPRDQPYEVALTGRELRRFDEPGPFLLDRASEVRTREGRLQLATRWAVNPIIGDPCMVNDANHWGSVDRAPKALVRVEPGDFTFGLSCRMRRAIFSPHTAGAARGCSLWGHLRSLPARDLVVPQRLRDKWAGDRELRFAFIVATPDRTTVGDAQLYAIDQARRSWDAAFAAATRGRWTSDSRLS